MILTLKPEADLIRDSDYKGDLTYHRLSGKIELTDKILLLELIAIPCVRAYYKNGITPLQKPIKTLAKNGMWIHITVCKNDSDNRQWFLQANTEQFCWRTYMCNLMNNFKLEMMDWDKCMIIPSTTLLYHTKEFLMQALNDFFKISIHQIQITE